MGGEQSTPSCNKLCSQDWDNYVNKEHKLQEGWEIILDDTRDVDTIYTMTKFLANFANIFENLFLGSKNSMSENIHATLVDVVVKRLQSIIQIDWLNHKMREFSPLPIHFMRINDDNGRNRKFQLIFVMALRIISTKKRDGKEEELDTHHANVEMSVRIQLRSKQETFVTHPTQEIFIPQPRCGEDYY